MTEDESYPRFVIKEGTDFESISAAHYLADLESSIYDHPQSMSDALLVYKATLVPKNVAKSIQELVTEMEVESDVEAVMSAFDMWKLYDQMGLYRYLLGFDAQTEAELETDQKLRDFVRELHSTDNRFKERTQDAIRTVRMSRFIGRVASLRSLHSEDSA